MARIVGVNIPDNKRIEIALTYIYGIGQSLSRQILKEVKIDLNKKTKELSEEKLSIIRKKIEEKKIKVEGELRQNTMMNIKRLKEIGCYRGIRHKKNLPVRGQQTKTNSRTVRGNTRKTIGGGKRKAQKT